MSIHALLAICTTKVKSKSKSLYYLRVDNREPMKVVQVLTFLLATPLLIEIYREVV